MKALATIEVSNNILMLFKSDLYYFFTFLKVKI